MLYADGGRPILHPNRDCVLSMRAISAAACLSTVGSHRRIRWAAFPASRERQGIADKEVNGMKPLTLLTDAPRGADRRLVEWALEKAKSGNCG